MIESYDPKIEIEVLHSQILELKKEVTRMKAIVTRVQVDRFHFTEDFFRIAMLKETHNQFWGEEAPDGIYDGDY